MTTLTSLQIESEVAAAREELRDATPSQILEWSINRFFPNVTLGCSFGGITGMAILDMVSKIEPNIEVFYLDTDFLFPETLALVAEIERRYRIKPKAYRSRWSVEGQAREFGSELWRSDPDLCCGIRKVEPNRRALAGKKAWIAGLRRTQSQSRDDVEVVEWDHELELFKINPLAFWTDVDVWRYLAENDVPYNSLNEHGYPSVGCTNCTRAIKPGEDLRAGRTIGQHMDGSGLRSMKAGSHDSSGEVAGGL